MSKLPRRLPPTPEERLKILLSRLGSSVSGQTRFEGPVNPKPTNTVEPGNTIFLQNEEPQNAGVGDLWLVDYGKFQ